MAKVEKLKIEEAPETLSMDPKKFILWGFIVTIIMLFASQTSAYLVRRAEGNWVEFEVPQIFWYSSVVLIISSIAMHWAYLAAKKDNFNTLKIAISITFVLGLAFLWMQVEAVSYTPLDVYKRQVLVSPCICATSSLDTRYDCTGITICSFVTD